MTSLRHSSAGPTESAEPTEPADPARDGYLDAARACILDVGWRRTTLTEVARRAGVSRMTIYRRWADMPTLLGDLMTREWATLSAEAARDAHDVATPDGLASATVALVRALRANEVFSRIVELDPELLLPYLINRRGRSQQALVELLADAIATGQRAGTMRSGDPEAIARALVLAGHGFVLSAHTMLDEDVTAADVEAELRLLVSRAVAP